MASADGNPLLNFSEGYRSLSLRLIAWRIGMLPAFRRVPDRLIVAPTDLRAADPFVAEEISQGRFPLAGRLLTTDGQSPFVIELPSREFAARLHSFSWLRHIRASRNDAYFDVARRLTDEWLSVHGKRINGIAWDLDIAAQRVLAWLSHSTILLKNADMGFYRRFLRSLTGHIRFLEKSVSLGEDGEPRLRIRIALAMASIALPASPRKIRQAAQNLDTELERQILGDGGHVSRNPRTGLELLLDLLPLRQTYVNLGHDLPSRLIAVIDRMFPALRFFRHQGGELALFNGATSTLANELMSVLRYDETAGKPFKALPFLKFQRMAAGETVLIIDTGAPISRDMSRTAHAGCLSFEMSAGRQRFIINSGSPRFAGEYYRQLARATAAHSTLVLNDTSSSRISKNKMLGPVFSDGVATVEVAREDSEERAQGLVAEHDGYLSPFGLIHERKIHMNSSGTLIRGQDRLKKADGGDPDNSRDDTASIRFHIHPQIELRLTDSHEAKLLAPDGECWVLSCMDSELSIDDDVYFADPSGIRAARQIEIQFRPSEISEVQWVLTRKTPVNNAS